MKEKRAEGWGEIGWNLTPSYTAVLLSFLAKNNRSPKLGGSLSMEDFRDVGKSGIHWSLRRERDILFCQNCLCDLSELISDQYTN